MTSILVRPHGPRSACPLFESTGFAIPSLEHFELRGTHLTDASPAIEGPETAVEIFANANGDQATASG